MKGVLHLKRFLSILIAGLFAIIGLTACVGGGSTSKGNIKFADVGWDSIKFHNAVAGIIAEEAFGYTWQEVPGSTPVVHEGILSGEVDVHMEEWTANIPTYTADLKEGRLVELGVNFDDNFQGFYVPRYVIEGDSERGIEAVAPNLKTVEDLKEYSDIFKDEEVAGKGRVYGSIPGWETDDIMHNKYLHYGLDENFIYFRPGSSAALASALQGAYEKGEPVVGYYWEPTWLMGKYDFVLLEDEPYDENTYLDGKTALPAVKVTIAVSNDFNNDETNSEMIEFLSKYSTSSQLTSDALAYMQDNNESYEETAKWFIKEHEDLIVEWLGDENSQKVLEAIK